MDKLRNLDSLSIRICNWTRIAPGSRSDIAVNRTLRAAPQVKWSGNDRRPHFPRTNGSNHGKHEFIQVLRLPEVIPMKVVADAVTQAMHLGPIGFDVDRQRAPACIERRPARLDLATYPRLPRLTVQTTRVADCAALVPGMAA
jgi:hypothetical protein